jgi:hypothetical protein
LHPADPCVGNVLSGGEAAFFNSAICVSWSDCHPPLLGGAENGLDVHGSDCHSQHLDPLLRVELSGLGMVRQSDPCGVVLSQYVNVCGANNYSVGWCRSECHSV